MVISRSIRSLSNPVACVLRALVLLAPACVSAQHVDEEVVVIATPRESRVGDLAQSITVVGGGELARVRAANLGETLEGQLGVSASSFGAGASRPVIRGLAGARVRTLVDGIDSMDAATVSADHAVGVDPLVARQIEIFRGPTTLLYGGGAVGGIVNTVTSRVPQLPAEMPVSAAFEVRTDSVADERSAAISVDGGGDSFAWHADATQRHADDYEIPADAASAPGAEFLANSSLRLSSYALGGSWLGDDASVGIAYSSFDTNYGIPPYAEAAADGESVSIDLEQRRLDLRGRIDLGTGIAVEGLRFGIGVNDYAHVELESGVAGTRFGNRAWEARFELLHAPIGEWSGAVGLQLGQREFSAIGEEAFVPPVDTDDAGVFVIEERQFPLWTLTMGARAETRRHQPGDAAPRVSGSATSVAVAAVRDFASGMSVALNLGSAERLPSAEELYSFGPHLATRTVEIGDAGLGVETSRHFDVSIRRTLGERSWAVTAFATDYADFIYLRDTGSTDAVEGLPVFAYAQRDATFTGLEAEFFTPLAEFGGGELDLRLFGDRVRATLAGGEPLPRLPPRRVGARLDYHRRVLSVGAEVVDYAAQSRIAPYETPTPGYTLVSVDLTRDFIRGERILTLFVRGTNLLDEAARRHTSFIKEIAPLPGRNLAIGLRGEF